MTQLLPFTFFEQRIYHRTIKILATAQDVQTVGQGHVGSSIQFKRSPDGESSIIHNDSDGIDIMPSLSSRNIFWLQWVAANSFAEFVGLGGVALLGFAIFQRFGEPHGAAQSIGLAVVMVALGALEGAVVGMAQARLPELRGWVSATMVGAAVAWAMGMVPSTYFSFNEVPSPSPVNEPSLSMILLLAALLGLIAGPLLAFFQWRKLRKVVPHGAALWLPANAAAWALGMPIIFLGAQANEITSNLGTIAILVSLSLLSAGAVVGAIHGRVLLWLIPRLTLGESSH
jgi:hypothetical protein